MREVRNGIANGSTQYGVCPQKTPYSSPITFTLFSSLLSLYRSSITDEPVTEIV